MLNEQLLADAHRLGGEKTLSATVNRALEIYLKRIRSHQILELRGSGLWEGDLAEMRGDGSR